MNKSKLLRKVDVLEEELGQVRDLVENLTEDDDYVDPEDLYEDED